VYTLEYGFAYAGETLVPLMTYQAAAIALNRLHQTGATDMVCCEGIAELVHRILASYANMFAARHGRLPNCECLLFFGLCPRCERAAVFRLAPDRPTPDRIPETTRVTAIGEASREIQAACERELLGLDGVAPSPWAPVRHVLRRISGDALGSVGGELLLATAEGSSLAIELQPRTKPENASGWDYGVAGLSFAEMDAGGFQPGLLACLSLGMAGDPEWPRGMSFPEIVERYFAKPQT
jgi:hypothetical protein